MDGSIIMITIGDPPYLECSSKGDVRFSAFFAIVNGQPIEIQYQTAKKFKRIDGITSLPWRIAKGKTPLNIGEVRKLYKDLWRQYLNENPGLIEVLKRATGLSDHFGQKGHQCQAITLWELSREDVLL
jgi:hypothetical protein